MRIFNKYIIKIILTLFFLLACSISHATSPVTVNTGVYILDIHGIDIKKETFKADLYFWISWDNTKSPENFDPTSFEIMNGVVEIKSTENTTNKSITWISWRYDGEFRAKYNFKNFPLDKQTLEIEIESSRYDSDELVFQTNNKDSQNICRISSSGWEMHGPVNLSEKNFNYRSNFGNPNRSPDDSAKYSRLLISIPLQHSAAFWTYLKLFLPVYISVCIAFLTFLIDPTDLDPRFGVGIAAIFGAVSSLIVANSSIPDTNYFSLSDKIHLTSLAFIFATILCSCILLKKCKMCKKDSILRLDLYTGSALFAAYILIILLITYSAINA